jgi:cell division protease FtsH
MSSKLGPMTLGHKDSQPFLGKEFGHQPDYSGQVAFQIDEEVRQLLDEAHDEALEILVENDHVLESLATKLLEVETVDGELLGEVFSPITKRPSRALSAPEADDPRRVIDKLRRLQVAGQHGHGAGGNGHSPPSTGERTTAEPVPGEASGAGPRRTEDQ